MNAEKSSCASVNPIPEWDQLDWAGFESRVRRLQARIVKATQERHWGRVKSLQWLLTHSYSGKALAVNRVTENRGKNTPGVDGEIWRTPAAKKKAIGMLQRRGYRPQPLRRVYIPKANGKLRPLGIPCMIDRAQQALHLLALEPVAETTGDRNSYGFRRARSTADAIAQAFVALSQKTSAPWVLEGDIKGCYDHISHRWMLENIPTDTQVLEKWLRSGYVESRTWFPTTEGTPQGGIISPAAANMTLDGLEELLRKRFPERGTRSPRGNPKVNLVRYADDFIITGSSKELLENEVRPLVEAFLRERGLTLSPEKTTITHISEGFDFLGQNLRKHGETLLITPSKKNVRTFYQKVKAILSDAGNATQTQVIWQLNPVLRGWANYHRHVSAKRTFSRLDENIRYALIRWAKRRHPGRSIGWICRKYWHIFGDRRRSVFAARNSVRARDGNPMWCRLVSLAATRIVRHVKIKSDANPFDPQWDGYFADRAIRKHYPAVAVSAERISDV